MINLEEFCRFWLGDLTEDELSCESMQLLLDITFMQFPDASDCELKYRALVNILQYLIRKESKGTSGSEGTGNVTRRKEKRGNTEIEVYWDSASSSGDDASWSSILTDLEDDPTSIGCTPFPDASGSGSVIIGVSKCRFDPVAPWRQNLITPTRKLW